MPNNPLKGLLNVSPEMSVTLPPPDLLKDSALSKQLSLLKKLSAYIYIKLGR